jgi:hypothetical protein
VCGKNVTSGNGKIATMRSGAAMRLSRQLIFGREPTAPT